MDSEQNKAVVRRWYKDVFEGGRLDVADEIFSADFMTHDPNAPGGWPGGPEGPKTIARTFRAAFPDLTYTVDDQVACGDMVVTRWTARGTHEGDLMGVPASHRHVEVTGIEIERLQGDKIAETWVEYNLLGLLQQVGAVPTMAQAAGATR